MGSGCKAAAAGTALTIKRALFVYKYDIPLPNGYEVADAAGTVGFIRDSDPILMTRQNESIRPRPSKIVIDAAVSRSG